MARRTLVLRLADLPDRSARAVAAPRSLVVARAGGEAFVYENLCPHAGARLSREDGAVLVQEGRFIVCPAHGASFDLETGACVGGPCNGAGLTRVGAAVEQGAVFVADD